MTGESRGFSQAVVKRVGFLSSYNGESRAPLVWPQGSPVPIKVVSGSAALLSSHGREIGPQDELKGESQGLSQVVTGNPGFPRLVTVTSGSFSWCLWDVRNTLVLGGASTESTGVSAMEEVLITS